MLIISIARRGRGGGAYLGSGAQSQYVGLVGIDRMC